MRLQGGQNVHRIPIDCPNWIYLIYPIRGGIKRCYEALCSLLPSPARQKIGKSPIATHYHMLQDQAVLFDTESES